MRWPGQLAIIAVVAGAGYGGWYAHREGYLANVPVLGEYASKWLGPAPKATGGPPAGRPNTPVVVDVDEVRTERIVDTREAVGTVRAYESVTITAKVSGIVESISFDEGQKVKAGDVLVTFDAAERRADIEQAVAETRRAGAQRDELRVRLERAQTLRRSGAGTEAVVEDLTAQLRTLESAIASTEARRRAAEARLEDLVVRAPFSGRLGTRSVSLGAYVSPGTRITTLDDLSRVRLDFSVPENLLGQLKPGQVVRARSAAFGDRVFEGKVSVIDPRIDPLTRTVRLTAEFSNPDEVLKPGMFMSAALEVTAKDNATVVPEEAVVSEGLRQLVYVVGPDNKIERRVIDIGQRQSGRIEVAEGLKPGERIVVRGLQRVRPGLTVEPRPIGAEQPAQAGGTRGAAESAPPSPRAATPAAGPVAAERRS